MKISKPLQERIDRVATRLSERLQSDIMNEVNMGYFGDIDVASEKGMEILERIEDLVIKKLEDAKK